MWNRTALAALAVALLAIAAAMRSYELSSQQAPDPYGVTAGQTRFAAALELLPATGVIGYLTDMPVGENTGSIAYMAAQYAVARARSCPSGSCRRNGRSAISRAPEISPNAERRLDIASFATSATASLSIGEPSRDRFSRDDPRIRARLDLRAPARSARIEARSPARPWLGRGNLIRDFLPAHLGRSREPYLDDWSRSCFHRRRRGAPVSPQASSPGTENRGPAFLDLDIANRRADRVCARRHGFFAVSQRESRRRLRCRCDLEYPRPLSRGRSAVLALRRFARHRNESPGLSLARLCVRRAYMDPAGRSAIFDAGGS